MIIMIKIYIQQKSDTQTNARLSSGFTLQLFFAWRRPIFFDLLLLFLVVAGVIVTQDLLLTEQNNEKGTKTLL